MRQWLTTQYKNAFLWAPFMMAGGAAMYFSASDAACAVACMCATVGFIAAAGYREKYASYACALFVFGFLYAAAFTHITVTPRMTRPMRGAEIEGTIEAIDYTPDKKRLFISVPASQIKSKSGGTARIRLNITDGPDVKIGDTVKATANIFPPAPAYAPETFDYSRWAYFNGLSATGYITDLSITSHDKAGFIAKLRDNLHTRAKSFLADTLVLGYKNAIPKEENTVWTAAGIGHVWSISGFHMTLVSGWLFAIFYCIFRLIPYITRRVPARIPALCCAWAGLLFYLFLSGLDVATIRAFLMTSLLFIAFIAGRNAISMRNICMAFCIIFLINPHYIMQPGFQLSFSAIFGLVWFWQERHSHKTTRAGKTAYAVYAAAMTSIVATVFTAPFIAAHFYSMPIYGLAGNLILLPIFSLLIMPAVVIGTITAPLGWHWPLNIADMVYNHTIVLAQKIASMPNATIIVPHIPNIAIVITILGFMCLMFIKDCGNRKIRLMLSGILVTTGIVVTATAPRPLFYATPDHELVAFSYDGKLEFNKSRASNHFFAFDTWRQINREPVGTPNTRRKGTRGVWIYKAQNFTVAYIQKFKPLAREIKNLCRDEDIDYIVSYFDIRSEKCGHKILRGGFVIYPSGRVRYSAPLRPWNSPRR